MHKSIFSPFIILFALAAGCSGGDLKRPPGNYGGLTATEYNRLFDLNRMQQDNIDARDAVHLIAPLLNEHSKPMSEKIAYPNCVKNGEIPDNDLTGQVHQETISSTTGSCPIRWYRERGWTLENKIMKMTDNLEILDPDYRKNYSRMGVRFMTGTYKILPNENGGDAVVGTILIHNFQTTDYGRITGSIKVDFDRNNNGGSGTVRLFLSGNRWETNALISWNYRGGAPYGVIYRVNNRKFDQSQFNDLFSAYELDKYMDNALNMK